MLLDSLAFLRDVPMRVSALRLLRDGESVFHVKFLPGFRLPASFADAFYSRLDSTVGV